MKFKVVIIWTDGVRTETGFPLQEQAHEYRQAMLEVFGNQISYVYCERII